MEPIGLTLLILGGLGAAGVAVRRERTRGDQRKAAQVRRDLHVADLHVQSDFQRARRAMNDAAGQSWRNLTG